MKWEPDIILDGVTVEMDQWLRENIDKESYRIKPHMFRFRFAGPKIPLSQCQRQEGWEIYFDNDEDAVAFKLRWM